MSIIPVSRLTQEELARLGNNVGRKTRRRPGYQGRRRMILAVNRSLAGIGESVATLHRPLLAAS